MIINSVNHCQVYALFINGVKAIKGFWAVFTFHFVCQAIIRSDEHFGVLVILRQIFFQL